MIVYLGSGIMNNIIVVRMKNKKSVLVNAFGKTDLIVKSIVGFLELFFISFHEISDLKLKTNITPNSIITNLLLALSHSEGVSYLEIVDKKPSRTNLIQVLIDDQNITVKLNKNIIRTIHMALLKNTSKIMKFVAETFYTSIAKEIIAMKTKNVENIEEQITNLINRYNLSGLEILRITAIVQQLEGGGK